MIIDELDSSDGTQKDIETAKAKLKKLKGVGGKITN